jgi:hypothetical protein
VRDSGETNKDASPSEGATCRNQTYNPMKESLDSSAKDAKRTEEARPTGPDCMGQRTTTPFSVAKLLPFLGLLPFVVVRSECCAPRERNFAQGEIRFSRPVQSTGLPSLRYSSEAAPRRKSLSTSGTVEVIDTEGLCASKKAFTAPCNDRAAGLKTHRHTTRLDGNSQRHSQARRLLGC